MCAFNWAKYPPKWITYLLAFLGVYTFLHWFLAVPLLYSHFFNCCHEKWSRNWIIWFLLTLFAFWVGTSILVLMLSCCLRTCCDSEDEKKPELNKNSSEIINLPEFDSGKMTVLQMNDMQSKEKIVSSPDLPIPIQERCHFVQEEPPDEKPPKSPREIFFQDLIDVASKSYFDFDPEKIADNIMKKSSPNGSEENTYFVGGPSEKENLKSEVLITLNEKGVIVDEPVTLGQFEILKE